MPIIDMDVSCVPDIIEAQLTLSYSRLTDLIRVIVDQGNGHEDDIDELRDRVDRLAQENGALRTEIEALKQARGPSEEVTAALAELRSAVAQLTDRVEANTGSIAAGEAAHAEATAAAAKRSGEEQAAMKATFDRHADAVAQRLSGTDASLRVLQAFADLWGAAPAQVLEMGGRTEGQQMEHSVDDRATYLLTLPPFAKVQEELGVLRALLQRQAADALVAKTSEAARTSRTASHVAAMAAPTEASDSAAEVERLSRTVRALEEEAQAVQQHRLPPLESAVHELQARPNTEKRVAGAEKDVSRIRDQLAQLEDRLNTLLGQTGEAADGGVDAAHPGLVDLARRVSLLEGTVEGWPQGGHTTAVPDAAAGGEAVSADAAVVAAPVRPSSRSRSSVPTISRPPSGRAGGGSGVFPALTKEPLAAHSGSPGAGGAGGSVSPPPPPPPRRASSAGHSTGSQDVVQPTVEALRRQEATQPGAAAGGRRISVAVEPDDGLRRRVAQLEENAAILEVNKADRAELRALEAALRGGAVGGAHATQQQQQLSYQVPPSQQQALSSAPTNNAPSLVPQRPVSAGGVRFTTADYAASQQRGDGFSRPTSSTAALGRPMFVGSSSSVYLRDGAQVTNATVSPTQLYRS
ncbi:hypothetical protein NESM_000052100 [Novymonas esmeraldas]|uniref:Uncharacterized protein n=1 Tax=Novymonas esmeraldas TaxID=1808958 RepID=A0AAW0F0J5_9TRYP